MPIETEPFDAAEHLTGEAAQMELLAEALESGDAKFIAVALGTIARARGMTKVAKDTGVSREALYKSLTSDGDPRLSTVCGVLKALGIKLQIKETP
ncbi:addiction module antidote protein [Microvirga arsenatis]|uniref:Addiction module antidote protein n=1 Tax=Microvirga arsenatis TaxID=2692265 RepID=A0ABW9Z379_9HYPH|nr:addiction module antidote protein [Microvirga arsenatis]NBJ13692.1 putative addiction module antidote protein [Microvirga arsenatis]NBJ27158.1 putative addiction module antidote protein [Microvirga arsenatis]